MSLLFIHSGEIGEKLEYVCNTVALTLYFNIEMYDSGSCQDSCTVVLLTLVIFTSLGGPGTANRNFKALATETKQPT